MGCHYCFYLHPPDMFATTAEEAQRTFELLGSAIGLLAGRCTLSSTSHETSHPLDPAVPLVRGAQLCFVEHLARV